jgi:hypothetical protein
MTKPDDRPDKAENPADRRPETLTDEKHGAIKDKQLEGSRRPNTDLPRGSEPATRASSSRR